MKEKKGERNKERKGRAKWKIIERKRKPIRKRKKVHDWEIVERKRVMRRKSKDINKIENGSKQWRNRQGHNLEMKENARAKRNLKMRKFIWVRKMKVLD